MQEPTSKIERVIIAGSRHYEDFSRLQEICDAKLKGPLEIVSGGARGADRLGEAYARLRGHAIKVFPADWATHGKLAGPLRNAEMVAYADRAIVFWDGRSRGSRNLIQLCQKAKLPLQVVVI
ncbi:MAG: DUF2493 domain-containing protein [Bacteroidota bacterium]